MSRAARPRRSSALSAARAGGLDELVTEAVLHAAFLPFGEIKDVSLPVDHGTQKNRGFGFVTFQEKCAARRAAPRASP